MKEEKWLSAVLYGICAFIWSVKTICEVFDTSLPTTHILLDAACAICWIVAFIAAIKRYRSNKKEQ